MKIELSKIHPSPNPIRKTWDEEKMKELQWSLMEEGQVEPIGVRQNGDGYIVVWGHRRVEAARRAGWDEIDCIIVPNDEINNLIQAGIENLASEDMKIADKINWYKRLINLGLNQTEISRRSTVPVGTLSGWQTVSHENELREIFDIKDVSSRDDGGVKRIMNIKTVLGDDTNAKKAVANKSVSDELTQQQTRSLAEAYRDAPQVRDAILKVNVEKDDTPENIINKAHTIVAAQTSIPNLMQAPAIVAGYKAIGDIGNGINFLKHVTQDVPTARLILKQWRGYLVTRLAEIDAIMEPNDASAN